MDDTGAESGMFCMAMSMLNDTRLKMKVKIGADMMRSE